MVPLRTDGPRASRRDLADVRSARAANHAQPRSATSLRRAAEGGSRKTILVALIADILIAIAKLIAGLGSGSTGMLAESAHSSADSVERGLSVSRPSSRRPAGGRNASRRPWRRTIPVGLHGCDRIVFDWRLPLDRDGHREAQISGSSFRRSHCVDHSRNFVRSGGRASRLQSVRQARRQAEEYKLTVTRCLFRCLRTALH